MPRNSEAALAANGPPRVRWPGWSFRGWFIGCGASLLIGFGAWLAMTVFIVIQNWPFEPPAHGPWGAMLVIVLSACSGLVLWFIAFAMLSLVYLVARVVAADRRRR